MKRIQYRKVRQFQPNFFEYTGEYKSDPVSMQLFIFNEEGYEEYTKHVGLERVIKECTDVTQVNDVKWLNVHGLHDTDLIRKIGDLFKVDSFVISDILNTSRRTRIEELGDVLFFSVKSILPVEEVNIIKTEQVSFLLKDNVIVSFQEKKSDYFQHIRERIRTGTGIVRKKQNDYLLYLMLDAIMENFYITLEGYEGRIETFGNEAKLGSSTDFITDVEKTKDSLNYLKRAITPLRDALYNLKSVKEDEEIETIHKTTHTYFARLHQKCLELLDQVEYDLNALDSASNFHFSTQSQRMNQIMKTLTIFSVIFMPLTFIVGVYGMNFDNMPELHTQYGYYVIWGVMVVVTIGMAIYFKRKGWF